MNLEEVLDIPLGPDNFIEPAEYDGMQPTSFLPVPSRLDGLDRRYYCTFSAIIPPGSESERVVWTLRHDGETYSVPAHINAEDYKIESPDQPGRNSVSPRVQFLDPAGPAGRGRNGDLIAGPISAEAGVPLHTIAKVLNHSDVATTEIYARISDNVQKKALDALAENLDPARLDVDLLVQKFVGVPVCSVRLRL